MRIIKLLAFAGLVGSLATPAAAQCNGLCEVGGAGTGGVNSDGSAQGFHYSVPGQTPGRILTNSGNSDAGRFEISTGGTAIGTATGTYRDGICRGSATGILGFFQGLDPDC